jgi:hypothetical protein
VAFDPQNLLKELDPTQKPGKLLLALNAAGMIFAAASNTVAIVVDKNTKPEDKSILVPAGALTGFANIAAYYAITQKIIDCCEEHAAKAVGGTIERKGKKITFETPEGIDITSSAKRLGIRQIEKAKNGKFFGLFGKKNKEDVAEIADTFFKGGKELLDNGADNIQDVFKNAEPTQYAQDAIKKNAKNCASVLGAFAGAVIGCAIITPIIRDIGAYIVQKRLEKKEPELKDAPYRPYFDPSHIKPGYDTIKQPLSMQNYMSFTNGSLKI